jgi:hypothetical protein
VTLLSEETGVEPRDLRRTRDHPERELVAVLVKQLHEARNALADAVLVLAWGQLRLPSEAGVRMKRGVVGRRDRRSIVISRWGGEYSGGAISRFTIELRSRVGWVASGVGRRVGCGMERVFGARCRVPCRPTWLSTRKSLRPTWTSLSENVSCNPPMDFSSPFHNVDSPPSSSEVVSGRPSCRPQLQVPASSPALIPRPRWRLRRKHSCTLTVQHEAHGDLGAVGPAVAGLFEAVPDVVPVGRVEVGFAAGEGHGVAYEVLGIGYWSLGDED